MREIVLQFGSRLGKTFFGLCAALYTAANDPAPMMHANSSESLCVDVIERMQRMVKHRPPLRALMASRHEKDWRQDEMQFQACRLVGAWALSVNTLADKDVKIGHAGEIDKWVHQRTSREGHPLKLFTDRFKNYMSVRKVIFESTPAFRNLSQIEPLRLSGSDCALNTPCPHCRRYQVLSLGSEQTPWGLKWDRLANGESDPERARETAHYRCRHCHGRIDNFDRAWMVRRGVWVPRGCGVDDAEALVAAERRLRPSEREREPCWSGWAHSPWVTGTPDRDGPRQSYQLGSLYALTLSWGDIAAEFVGCHDKPQLLQNFVNQWLGETWEARKTKTTPERLAERIGSVRPARLVPHWGRFLTVSVDQQRQEGGFRVFTVIAHGLGDRAAVVHHGRLESREEVWEQVCRAEYPHADGGAPLTPVLSGFDSGWDTRATYEFVNQYPGLCVALKGSDTDLGGKPYRLALLGDEGKKTRTGAEGQLLLWVNTDFWETDVQHRLDLKLADEPGSLTLSAAATQDPDLLAELLNAELSDKLDRRGEPRLLWQKKHEHEPNDARDCVRYGLCLGQAWLDDQGGVMPERAAAVISPKSPPAAVASEAFVRKPEADAGGRWIRRRT